MHIMNVGIMSRQAYQERTIAIAKGEHRATKANEPKIWFESIKSLAQVLSDENQELLKLIVECKPQSLTELEQISHRKKSNLSKALRTLENYGIISLTKEKGRIIPIVKVTDFRVEFGLNSVGIQV